jgi:hypothetical protein
MLTASIRPSSRAARGRVTPAWLLLAVVAGAGAYASVLYGPLLLDRARVRALVAEAAQRSVSFEDDERSRAWFDGRAAAEGFPWLSAGNLYWRRLDREHLDVGLRWQATVRHPLLGPQTLDFAFYCSATPRGCAEFRVPSREAPFGPAR